MQDLKKIHDKPNDSFDMDLAEKAEKTRCIKLYGLLASLMRGRALQLVKAVEDSSNTFDAWRSLKALKPTSKARGLALLRAAATWPAFSMNSALQLNFSSWQRCLRRRYSESRRADICNSFEMRGWTAQLLLELD